MQQSQNENTDRGQLQVSVVNSQNNYPVENAKVRIAFTGDPDSVVEELVTDSGGGSALFGIYG